MCVDADFFCKIGVECDLLRSLATEDHYGPAVIESEEIIEDGLKVMIEDIELGYQIDNVRSECRENTTTAIEDTNVYGGDEWWAVTASTIVGERESKNLPATVDQYSGSASLEDMVTGEVVDDDVMEAFEHSVDEEQLILSICHRDSRDNVTTVTDKTDMDLIVTTVLQSEEDEIIEAIVKNTTAVMSVYEGDESQKVAPSTLNHEGGMECLPITGEYVSVPKSREGMPIVPVKVGENGDGNVKGMCECSVDEERPIHSHSICNQDNVTINLAYTTDTDLTFITVPKSADNEIPEAIVEMTGIYGTKEWRTVTESTSNGEYELKRISTNVEHDSSLASPDGMSITSMSVVNDNDNDVTEAFENSAEEERAICSIFHLNNVTMTLADTTETNCTATTVTESMEDKIPEAIGEDDAGVEDVGRDHERRGEVICDPVTEPTL